MKEKDGYVVVEASFLLPFASILILLLVYLCSYLYQGCFMVQAAYRAAFRGSRYAGYGAEYVEKQLDEILKDEILSFEPEERTVNAGILSVSVSLEKDTPFQKFSRIVPKLETSWKVYVRDPAAYIRGLRIIGHEGNGKESGD